jgi:general secretion pathway protein G
MIALRQLGITLLELLLVMALVGILGAVALPAYRGHVDRVDENRAIADLGSLSLQLYRWQTNTGVFPETLAQAGLDGIVDPWGRAYAYLDVATAPSNAVRKDKNLHPINTDFDLYSLGKDGVSQLPLTAGPSRDDVIRANNGAYLGRAEDY